MSSPHAAVIGAPYDNGMAIHFDSYGNLDLVNGSNIMDAPLLTIIWNSAAASSTINVDLGPRDSNRWIRAIGNRYVFDASSANGYVARQYMKTTIDHMGYMWAHYDNGSPERYALIPILTFPDKGKLVVNPWESLD